MAGSVELAAGLLTALGALGPIGPALVAAQMTTAAGTVHAKKGFFNERGGFELNAMYGLLALLLAVDDYGRRSVDETIRLRDKIPDWLSFAAVAGGVAAGIALLRQRKTEKQPPHVVVGEVEASSKTPETTFAPGI
jgi:putative oxidoreductase